jgi:hypothetical protein
MRARDLTPFAGETKKRINDGPAIGGALKTARAPNSSNVRNSVCARLLHYSPDGTNWEDFNSLSGCSTKAVCSILFREGAALFPERLFSE